MLARVRSAVVLLLALATSSSRRLIWPRVIWWTGSSCSPLTSARGGGVFHAAIWPASAAAPRRRPRVPRGSRALARAWSAPPFLTAARCSATRSTSEAASRIAFRLPLTTRPRVSRRYVVFHEVGGVAGGKVPDPKAWQLSLERLHVACAGRHNHAGDKALAERGNSPVAERRRTANPATAYSRPAHTVSGCIPGNG
jgi:hypothetical protein